MNWIITDNWGNSSEVRIILSNNEDILESSLRSAEVDGWETATVEAEFGSRVITGSWATLAHHADGWQNRPCPCLYRETRPTPERLVIGVSHFDLDTLGGVLSILGLRQGMSIKNDMTANDFWNAVAFIDVNGPQRMKMINKTLHPLFNAFWAWSEDHRLIASRDGSVLNVTDFFLDARDIIELILDGDESLLKTGYKWAADKADFEKNSFVACVEFGKFSGLVRKTTGKFVNSLYAHDGYEHSAIIGYNSETRAITLSFERSGIGNAREIMQSIFGPEAGGHDGIAGTPRKNQYTLQDTGRVVSALLDMINK